ncbi:N-acetylmuramoyl-L-alanine amidase [Haliangium ochraceum]|uniref:N-acetylmuramoyl-L-alanine amidase domain-containing protein n=1 Tax=Haliangium ochraceum (strain DSM 14365 / JCM 11303 / SMP-2) TaxID=502025 RepID=D0LMT0_HALO1|nr:N-acetylmuramoyl-L-alanine amidase [Haliangium ochraceum]ACY13301.1 hypothetical protein Hoch_0670 [Haliangium ochraceum DSM 14365]
MSAANTLIVAGKDVAVPHGLRVRNWRNAGVYRFPARNRAGRTVNELILHETCTRDVATTVRVLRKRRLGVQLIVAADGEVTQHGDLAHDRLAHAGGHNGPSVGIEVVNPYYPRNLRDALPWKRVIDAPWAHEKRYVVPTLEQAEATSKLVRLLTGSVAGLSIPRTWRGIRDGKLVMSRLRDGEQRIPGIYAHTYFHHADGAWLVLYAWLRLEAGLPPCVAYEEAIHRGSDVRWTASLADHAAQSVA